MKYDSGEVGIWLLVVPPAHNHDVKSFSNAVTLKISITCQESFEGDTLKRCWQKYQSGSTPDGQTNFHRAVQHHTDADGQQSEIQKLSVSMRTITAEVTD